MFLTLARHRIARVVERVHFGVRRIVAIGMPLALGGVRFVRCDGRCVVVPVQRVRRGPCRVAFIWFGSLAVGVIIVPGHLGQALDAQLLGCTQ